MDDRILKYVQRKIVESSKDREVGIKYGEKGFGKRPDVLQFESDVYELAKQGVTSFHVSEERWKNPLWLETGMNKAKLDDLRSGWDCLIDLDTKFVEYGKIAAVLVTDALRFHDVKNFGVKFSGGSGFHIGIPFEAFPEKIDGKDIKLLFPDGVRVVAGYLKKMIEEHLRKGILEVSSVDEIVKAMGKEQKELVKNGRFDPFSVVEIDSVLISSRHLYRCPYSINEKKGLASIPLRLNEIKNFNLTKARIENVEADLDFLPKKIEYGEASTLIMQAFDELKKNSFIIVEEEKKNTRQFDLPKLAVKMEYWPPCIKQGLEGLDDGKKRFLFVLINFLKCLNWDNEGIEKIVMEWNKKNKQPLKDGYIISQLSWHKRQKEKILPPNCSNKAYYTDIGLKCNDSLCKLVNNPVNYAIRRMKMMEEVKKKSVKKKASKSSQN